MGFNTRSGSMYYRPAVECRYPRRHGVPADARSGEPHETEGFLTATRTG
ncbi:hypothetical protein [Streptomyces sp. NPDC055210]